MKKKIKPAPLNKSGHEELKNRGIRVIHKRVQRLLHGMRLMVHSDQE